MENSGSAAESGRTSGNIAVLTLRRRKGGARDLFRAYSVLIDGETVGRIRRGQSQQYEVLPGPHIVHLEIDWCRSPAVEVTAEVGFPFGLVCAPGGSAFKARRSVTVDADTYISLTRE